MFCPQCGKEVKDGVKFCENCGWAVPAAPAQNAQPSATPAAMPHYQNAAPSSQNVPAGKSHNAFFALSILFIVGGMVLNIVGLRYWQHWDYQSRRPDEIFTEYVSLYLAYEYYTDFSLMATGIIAIGILFSVISFLKKPDKKYLWLSISTCILLVVWNVFVLLVVN
jgi:hypothetical protein